MQQRVEEREDPSKQARSRLQLLVQECLPEIQGGSEACASFLNACSEDRLEKFFRQWCAKIYSLESVEQEWDLRQKPQDQSLKDFFQTHSQKFYTHLLKGECHQPLQAQKITALEAVAPWEVAKACERLAVGFGLPKDGHLVHSCLQGQAIYHFMGSDGGLKLFAMQTSESSWNQAGSKLPLIVLASSAAGKDNLKAILTSWLDELRPEFPLATAFTGQGNLTVSGLLKKLEGTGGQLQLLQSELDKFVQKKRQPFCKRRTASNFWTEVQISARAQLQKTYAARRMFGHWCLPKGMSICLSWAIRTLAAACALWCSP